MKIQSTTPFLSLQPFEWHIPDFSILIGVNGAGKSQLLSLLNISLTESWPHGKVQDMAIPSVSPKYFNNDEIGYVAGNWDLLELHPIGLTELQLAKENDKGLYDDFKYYLSSLKTGDEYYGPNRTLFKDFLERLNKTNEDIDKSEFEKYFSDKYTANPLMQLTNSKIGLRFYNYHIHSVQSKLASNSEQDFIDNHGKAPWNSINEIFESINLDLRITDPSDVDLIDKYTPNLINGNGKVIKFQDLSSGEKVLTSLVFWLFNKDDYTTFPKVLLLDEPDAHLHPEMSVRLLKILYNVLYKQYGVKIVMTTHSPTTVALAEEDVLYQVNNKSSELIRSIKKDEALDILTEFLPNLSIDYKNHKQVFCESPTDVKYYQALYDKHLKDNPKDPKFYFISNSAGEGNCSEVYSIVSSIRKSGNITSYGIVDWDNNNRPNGYTKVHGEGERWAVENFLLDPFYVIGILAELRVFNILKEFGIEEHDNPYTLGEKSNQELQEIADKYFLKIRENKRSFDILKKRKIEYYNGKSVELPIDFLMMGKHEFEDIVKNTFISIHKKYGKGFGLQEATIKVMARNYPFVPKTSMEFLKSLADN